MHLGRSGPNDGKHDGNALACEAASAAATDVNRSAGRLEGGSYLAVWMNLMTPLPRFGRPKFRLTML